MTPAFAVRHPSGHLAGGERGPRSLQGGAFVQPLALALLMAAGLAACSANDVTSPSSTEPNGSNGQPATPQSYTLRGQVNLGKSNVAISSATVRIDDGPNAGRSAVTDAHGNYAISGLASGVMTATASAEGHLPASRAITFEASGAPESTVNWPLVPIDAWNRGGSGNTVFELPGYFSRVRIQAAPRTECERFVVRIAGHPPLVDALLGTCSGAQARIYDGVHLTEGGGTVEIVSATAIDWMFNELRDLQ